MTGSVPRLARSVALGWGLTLGLVGSLLPGSPPPLHRTEAPFTYPSIDSNSIVFEDEFEGTTIDPGKWNVSAVTSGTRWCPTDMEAQHNGPGTWLDVSIDPCHDLTQQPPYGVISLADGQATFSSGPGRAFPYIWVGPPSRPSPFPAMGDFVMETIIRYEAIQTHGDGLAVLNWENTEPIGNNPPGPVGQAVFTIWADRSTGLLASLMGQVSPISEPLASHHYTLEYTGGVYSLFIDGNLLLGPTPSSLQPNALWIGNPVFTYWAEEEWTDFALDSIRITIPGLDHHTRDGFHVFTIDMQSNLSYEMVMADDVTSANYGKPSASPRERVRAMVAREPYVSRYPVLAFNADYFGPNQTHGPEGLTVKNGSRFDGSYADPPEPDWDQNERIRSSLSISDTLAVRIGKLDECRGRTCAFWAPTPAHYNTVGGGPLFVDEGKRIGGANSVRPCTEDRRFIEQGYCNTNTRFRWTAAGITQDGRYLIVVVSDLERSMDEAAAVLIAEGAWRAIKLDGGSSTQVWYRFGDPQIIIDGAPVANALLVFSSP